MSNRKIIIIAVAIALGILWMSPKDRGADAAYQAYTMEATR